MAKDVGPPDLADLAPYPLPTSWRLASLACHEEALAVDPPLDSLFLRWWP
jgi:hypothetical protein